MSIFISNFYVHIELLKSQIYQYIAISLVACVEGPPPNILKRKYGFYFWVFKGSVFARSATKLSEFFLRFSFFLFLKINHFQKFQKKILPPVMMCHYLFCVERRVVGRLKPDQNKLVINSAKVVLPLCRIFIHYYHPKLCVRWFQIQ